MNRTRNRASGERRGQGRADLRILAAVFLAAAACPGTAWADKIENPIAVFAALDKVTARIEPLAINIGNTSQFGALKVTPRVCFSRPPTEPPLTTAFVEVDEIKLDGSVNRIFTGWMYANSPGLHAVEHPVFDVWLTNCKTESGDTSAESEKKSADTAKASSNRP